MNRSWTYGDQGGGEVVVVEGRHAHVEAARVGLHERGGEERVGGGGAPRHGRHGRQNLAVPKHLR